MQPHAVCVSSCDSKLKNEKRCPNTGTAFRTAISNKLFSGWVLLLLLFPFLFHSYDFLMWMIYSFLPNQNIRSFIYVSTNTFKLWYAMLVFSCKTMFLFISHFFPICSWFHVLFAQRSMCSSFAFVEVPLFFVVVVSTFWFNVKQRNYKL